MDLSQCCVVDTSRLSVCSHCQVCSHGPVSVVRWIPLGCLSVVTVRYVVMDLSQCCEADTSRLSVCSHCQVCSHGPVTVL